MPRRLSPAALAKLSAAKLREYKAAWNDESAAATDDLIAAGRGHVKFAQTRDRAKEGDGLAVRFIQAYDAEMDAHSEINDRRRWHGSEKPIPNNRPR